MDKFSLEMLDEFVTDEEKKDLEEAVYNYYSALEDFKEGVAALFKDVFERLNEDDS